MNLIDEEDDVAIGVCHLFDDALQALLKLAFVFGTGDQSTHVERIELLILQVLRHIAAHDTLSKTFNDSGLTGTWLTDQNRIVLCTSREDLKHTAYLLITSDDRVEFTLAGFVYEVTGIFRERLVVVVSTLTLYFLSLAQFLDCFHHLLLRAACIFEDTTDGGVDLQQSQKDRFHRNKLVTHLLRIFHSFLQYGIGVVGEVRLTAFHARQVFELLLYEVLNLHGIDAKFLEHKVRHVAPLLHDTLQEVHRLDGLLVSHLSCVHSLLDGFLSFDCKFVECHILSSFLIF